MAKVGTWSTTAGSNNATPPDGAPEGMAPSTVNDTMREMMASIRTVFNDAQYFDQNLTPTYISATTFSVTGNQTSAIHAGRRLKVFDATAGVATTIYATVTTASFTTVTTIAISADAGQLTSSLSSFAIAILSKNNDSLPRGLPISASAIGTENLTVNGTTTASGAVVLKTTLNVEGATSLSGAVACGTTLSVSATAVFASNVAMGLTTASERLVVSGALRATSSANNFMSGLEGANLDFVAGIGVRIGHVTGAAGNALPVQIITGGDPIATFGSAGGLTLPGLLSIGGTVTLSSTLSVSGAAVLKSTLLVEGTTSLSGAVACATTLSVSGAAVLKGALSVGGAVIVAGATQLAGTLSVSGTVVAANVTKAWCKLSGSNAATLVTSFNVGSTSRSATGTYRITFTNAFVDSDYAFNVNAYDSLGGVRVVEHAVLLAGSLKFRVRNGAGSTIDADIICANFFR